jgi:hypothetical protein
MKTGATKDTRGGKIEGGEAAKLEAGLGGCWRSLTPHFIPSTIPNLVIKVTQTIVIGFISNHFHKLWWLCECRYKMAIYMENGLQKKARVKWVPRMHPNSESGKWVGLGKLTRRSITPPNMSPFGTRRRAPALPTGHPPCPLYVTRHLSVGEAKKHTPKPSPPLIPSWCKINGLELASHGSLTHHGSCRCSNGKRGVIPTYHKTPGGPTPKGEAPHVSGGCKCNQALSGFWWCWPYN